MYVTRHVTEIRMLLDMLRGYVRDLINKWTHTLLDVLQGHVRLLNVLRGYVRYLICYRDMYVTSYVTVLKLPHPLARPEKVFNSLSVCPQSPPLRCR